LAHSEKTASYTEGVGQYQPRVEFGNPGIEWLMAESTLKGFAPFANPFRV